MNKIENRTYDETYYEEVLANGLDVVIWHKPDYTTTSCIFAAPYGSLDMDQKDDQGNVYHFPSGIAHFLEHKLFESDHGDVMSDFSRMGANVNAFTSFQETCYYFDTAAEDIREPLNLLLDFVQDLSITDASVEKEKGIINQELAMYLQMPDSRMMFETFRSMYRNHPLKYDIGGCEQTVNSITKPLLEQCYAINYHPANMMCVIVTPADPEAVMAIVRENQAKKTFGSARRVQRFCEEEPAEVVKAVCEVPMDVSETKACVGIKIPVIAENDEMRVSRDWAAKMTLDSWFSSMNPQYQNWLDQKRITPYFSYEEDFGRDYSLMLFYDEAQDPEAFRQFVAEQLDACLQAEIRTEDLDLMKKRAIGSNLHLFNAPSDISVAFFRNRMNGVSLFENFRIIEDLTPESCARLMRSLDVSRRTLTIIRKG